MAKSYISSEETKERINEFSMEYMMNPNLSINKTFKEQVTKFKKITFGAMTQQHISKILFKKIRVLAIFMFIENIQKNLGTFQIVELCHLYNYKQLCLYLLFSYN